MESRARCKSVSDQRSSCGRWAAGCGTGYLVVPRWPSTCHGWQQNQRGGKGGGSEKIGMWMDGDREG